MGNPDETAASEVHPGPAWPLALAFTTIVGTLLTACMMPFVALALITAATMKPRTAVVAMTGIWLVNQLLGFTLLGFPLVSYAFAWGGALGAASLAAMAVARTVVGWTGELVATRLAAAFVAAFAAYEILLFGFAGLAGGLETFTPGIVAQ